MAIFWFTGQPHAGKTTLANHLKTALMLRNSLKLVYMVDGDDLRRIINNKDYSEQGRRTNIKNAQALVEYLHICECDVVVSLVAPYLDLREEFKDKIGNDIVEIFVHTTEARERDHFHVANYEQPQVNFIDINTTKDSPDTSFSKLINNLNKINKL